MRKFATTLLIASALVAGLAFASAIYAQDTQGSRGSMMGSGMMGMMGMMNMMGQMGQMIDQCNQMMGGMMGTPGSPRPNEQWRDKPPAAPEKKG